MMMEVVKMKKRASVFVGCVEAGARRLRLLLADSAVAEVDHPASIQCAYPRRLRFGRAGGA